MRLLILVSLLTLVLAPALHAEPVRVFVMAGQSNMVGGGSVRSLPTEPLNLRKPQEDVMYNYWVLARELGIAAEWIPLKPLVSEVRGTTYGPEITFGRQLADSMPDEQIAIIKVAANGTDLNSKWHPDGSNGTLYQSMLDHVAQAINQLEEADYEPTISGLVWVQGNGDTSNGEKGAAYEQNLHDLIGAVRQDWNVADLPVIFNQLHADSRGSAAGVAAIRQSQANVASDDGLALLVNVDDLELKWDNVHYTGPTYQELGYRLADAYLNLTSPRSNQVLPEPSGIVLFTLGVFLLGMRRATHPAS